MKLSPDERAARRKAFREMNAADKLCYIFAYYKAPIFAAAVAVALLVGAVHRQLTKKEPILYLGIANVAIGDEVLQVLNEGFIATQADAPRRAEVYFYRDLYLSQNASAENHEYAYASRLKVLAAITDERLDLVLMNREAYDLFSQNGWLAELPTDSALAPYLAENTVILQDNAIEFELGEAEEYRADTVQAVNAVSAAGLPRLAAAGFDGEVFVGVIGNTPRPETVRDYLAYLATE